MTLPLYKVSVTIPNGTAISAAFAPGAGRIVGFLMPAAWTTAGLSFQGSPDDVTFGDMFDGAGAEVVVSALTSEYVLVPTTYYLAAPWMKIRSGTTGSPTNQGADRTIVVLIEKFPS